MVDDSLVMEDDGKMASTVDGTDLTEEEDIEKLSTVRLEDTTSKTSTQLIKTNTVVFGEILYLASNSTSTVTAQSLAKSNRDTGHHGNVPQLKLCRS